MNREQLVAICKRVNSGETLEDICRLLQVKSSYIEMMIKTENIKKSSILNIYYSENSSEEVRELERQKKSYENMDLISNLWLKRYRGIGEVYEDILDEADEWADQYREEVEVNLNFDLLNELKELAEEEGLSLSLYMEKLLLQMLERNKETKMHTKGKKMYIKTMAEINGHEEDTDDIIRSVKKKGFMKFKDFSYTNKTCDMKIYYINYLLNNGYSFEQLKKVVQSDEAILEDDSFSESLKFHYLMIRSMECKTFEEVQNVVEDSERQFDDVEARLNEIDRGDSIG